MENGKPTKAELFAPFNEMHSKVAAAEEATRALITERNQYIGDIVKHYGPGPYKLRDGTQVKFQKHPRTKLYSALPVKEPEEV